MSGGQKFSEEFLNAFVDDQLSAEERARVFTELGQDEALNRQVCELRKLRDLVRTAYQHVEPAATGRRPSGAPKRRGFGVAAGVALAIGVALGWLLHERPDVAPEETVVATAKDGEAKIVVHMNESSPWRVGETLDEVEALLKHYRRNGQLARVEVVINGDGLDALRTETAPAPERIRRMQQTYDNLTFVACQNTIDRLKREKGVVAKLLPGVVVIDSGVAQLMRRQQQGWAYIQA